MPLMTRTRKVLPIKELNVRSVYYMDPEPELGQVTTGVFVTREDYADMGAPQVITLTIEPGDHLNEDQG